MDSLDELMDIPPKSTQKEDALDRAMNFYDTHKNVAFKASTNLAVDTNPDEIARQKRIASILGQPIEAVQALPKESSRAVKMREIESNTAQAPTLRKAYTDADFAKLAHDDSGNLSAIEGTLSAIGSAVKYLVSAPDQERGLVRDIGATAFTSGRMLTGLARAGVETLAIPEDYINNITGAGAGPLRQYSNALGKTSTYLGKRSKEMGSQWDENSPMQQIFGGGVTSGVQSAIQSLGTGVAASYLLGPEIGIPVTLAALAFGQGGESYQKAREKGAGHLQSLAYGAEDATAEYTTEKFLGLGGFLKNAMSGASVKKLAAYEIFKELPGETGATLWQNFNEWTNLNPEKSVGEFLQEQPAAIAQTVVATIAGGGAQIGAVKSLGGLMDRMGEKLKSAQQAEQTAQAFTRLDALAAASKVRGRDTDTFESFIKEASQDGPVPDVYISADALHQSGVAEQIAAASPAVAEQFDTAFATGGDVRIPVSEYLTYIAGTDLSGPLLDHLKTEPDGYSKAEAQQYMDSHADELQKEIERTLADKQGDDVFKESQKRVKETILERLNSANRFTSTKNEVDATIVAARYAVRAAQLGITPEQLFEQRQLNIAAQSVNGGAVFNQSAPETPEFKNWFGDSKVVDDQGKPLVVYHGTAKAFNTFKSSKTMDSAFWFTSNKKALENGEVGAAGQGDVIPVYLSAKKLAGWDEYENKTYDQLIAEGYDGIKLDDDFIVFDPKQIKSATDNNGNYDINDSNILHQATRCAKETVRSWLLRP